MKKSVVITGVSSGIGFATARAPNGRGDRVFGGVRREPHSSPVRRVRREYIVAGIAPDGPLLHQPPEEIRQAFEINVFGVIAVIRAFLPLLGARSNAPHPRGRIINISSFNGGVSVPFAIAYSASKHALEAISDGLRRELWIYGIDVIAIEPGTIRTEIWSKFRAFGVEKRYAGTDYGGALAALPGIVEEEIRKGDPVEKVSEAICRAIESPHPKARYPLTAMWYLARLVPARLLDRELTKRLRLR